MYFRSHCPQYLEFFRGAFGIDGQDAFVAFYGAYHRQAVTGVAGGGFDYRGTGFEKALLFRFFYHMAGYTVFHGVSGVVRLDFCIYPYR